MAEKKSWQYWKAQTYRGRAVWRFLPPAECGDKDWSGNLTVEQTKFLAAMSDDFIYDKKQNPNSGDKVFRSQCPPSEGTSKTDNPIKDAARAGINFYQSLQTADGNWTGDYGGPMFLLPGIVIASHITESPFAAPEAALMSRYMLNHQNDDGGWGLHLEGASTMFGTVLQYVALRILGLTKTNEQLTKARDWIRTHGSATEIPSWGKFYLSLLGVYEWEGCNSLFPEMWQLPEWLPVHPSRYWCHTRMVYLPMSYCYGHKLVGKKTRLTDELREELYTQSYDDIDWRGSRNTCSAADLYYPQSPVLKVMNGLLNVYEKYHSKSIRMKALDFVLEYINAEDEQTNYINTGPVNQAINSICIYHAYGKESAQFKKHRERWADYLWVAEDGMKMQGYNGSQLWDTAFAVQAVVEGGFEKDFPVMSSRALDFIDKSQILSEVADREKFYRHIQVGGWPFSTVEHGWPITDCTAEGLKTMLLCAPDTDPERLYKAVHVILSFQNKNGGWASYENTRGPKWLEAINPSEIFGDIMIDHSYTECTSASVQALLAFQEKYPAHIKEEVQNAIKKGIAYILAQQCTDGSWYGSWAVCFTYGTWFGIEALSQFVRVSKADNDLHRRAKKGIDKAVQFLISKQNGDGGWGESFESCVRKEYIPSETSQVVNTSWALLSLMAAEKCVDSKEYIDGALPLPASPKIGEEEYKHRYDRDAIARGIKLILSRQDANGDWPQENISGVFNHNCMITYTSYRNVFPIWALGRYLLQHDAAI